MKNKKIYISGPMSGLPENNYPAFNETARVLRANGHKVYNPAEIGECPRRIPDKKIWIWLTPEECERLQGFPTGWTRIPWRNKTAEDCPDGPRYKSIGNSMAVNVMSWIGHRIQREESK